MDMNTGKIIEITDERREAIKNRLSRIEQTIEKTEISVMADNDIMPMTDEQKAACAAYSPRNARRYMLNQLCPCKGGKKAKNCCYGK